MADCFLEISSFVGFVACASHYYGSLWCRGEEEMVAFSLTQQQATRLNKAHWSELLSQGIEMYEAGQRHNGFDSEQDVIAWAVNQWRARFAHADRLVLGDHCYREEHPVLDERAWWPAGVPARRGDG